MIIRRTMAQALISFLKNQYTERDGQQHRFFAGCLGIFGHGNVAGIGQALEQDSELRYFLFRNEQAMVHAATAFAKASFRMRTLVCTSSIGPGATNMVTGAAAATINRLPVLLLPGDIFARRNVAPVLQQLESPVTQDISVNDCFKPVSRYWDRIQRPEQLLTSLPEAMRVLTSPAETGAVVLSLPQDVQAEAFDFPEEFFHKRVWTISRTRCDQTLLQRAAEWIRAAKKPLIVAGGGVLYSGASEALAKFVQATGIPVCETQAGKGALPYDHPQELGAVGVTGTPGANILAREAELILGIGTRYSDFTTASKTAFQNPAVRFININVSEFDAFKHGAIGVAAAADVIDLTGTRRLDEMPKRFHQIVAVNVVADLFAFVTEHPIRLAGCGASHEVRQKTMQLGSGVSRARQATAPKTDSFHPEVAAIFLDQKIRRRFGNAKEGVLALIDAHGFRNALLPGMIRGNFPTLFQFPQRQLIWRVAVYFVGGGKDERSLWAKFASCL